MFLNLIRNALEAVDTAGHVTLAARLRPAGRAAPDGKNLFAFGQCASSGKMVDIEVRDDGHGIPADLLPRILDPFLTTKEVGKGSGLGLFIAFEIVEEHGGCIAVESEPGTGTVFHVCLPAKKTPPPRGIERPEDA